jgi:hypothetical protein
VIEGVAHRPGFGVTAVEEHQHQVGQVDDVIGDAQGGGALGVGIESGRVDDDLAAQVLAATGLELQVGVDARAFADGDLVDLGADLVEGEARVGIQCHPRQGVRFLLVAVADDGEAVVHRLVATALQLFAKIVVDEGGLARREGAQYRDQGPPGDLGGV